MDLKVPLLSEMPGMWRRSLIIQPDGTRDFTTQVRWLQARSLFVDLRQPAALPDLPHLRCLNDMTADDCEQLSRQQGFAGHFLWDGDWFEWRRLIDFQPPGVHPDAGRLVFEEGTLIETGRHEPYVEHWQCDPTVVTRPLAAVRLRDLESGVAAVAVLLGTVFMFARDRQVALRAQASLTECVSGAGSVQEARAILDCEITLGSAAAEGGNVVLASTLPWRVFQGFVLECGEQTATTQDVDADGNAVRRHWDIIEAEGDPATVWSSSGK